MPTSATPGRRRIAHVPPAMRPRGRSCAPPPARLARQQGQKRGSGSGGGGARRQPRPHAHLAFAAQSACS
jgi:hypothetical protein